MPGMRTLGMDNEFYDRAPMTTRPPLLWPGNARVALCVIVNLEHYEWNPPADAWMVPAMPSGGGKDVWPHMAGFSHREYGNRVGIFRVMRVLERYGINGTVAMDATVAKNYPFLVRECQKRGWEFIGHGITVNRMITSQMSEEQERHYIRTSIEAIAKATGNRPVGWLGPGYGESTRTPILLAEEGIRYVCDWPNDEQPYKMKVPHGSLTCLPVSLDLDDSFAIWTRHVSIMQYSQMIQENFDVLYRDGARSGRVLVLNLHPWLIGQPFRIKYLDQALAHISKYQEVWRATGREITDWYASHPPGNSNA